MDKKEFIFPGVILGVVIIIAIALIVTHSQKPTLIPETGGNASSTASSTVSHASGGSHGSAASGPQEYYLYGTTTLALNQAAAFKDGMSIRPLAVLEDSRCPLGVLCIQAGTVRVSLKLNSDELSTTTVLKLGDSIKAGHDTVQFTSVEPVRMKDAAPAKSAYRFVFTITHGSTITTANPCHIGGCSGEVCSDSPGAISTCIYRSEYACYKAATCERQMNGSCGWTQSDALKACLANPPALK